MLGAPERRYGADAGERAAELCRWPSRKRRQTNMDWKQFFAEIVSSLAWPTVAVVFLIVFRSEVSRIIQRLAHLKYKGLELDFDKVRQQAEEIHKEIGAEQPRSRSPVLASLEDQVLDAVERAPSAAILLAWSSLETAMAAAVARLAISPESPSYRSPMHNIEMLTKYAGLPEGHTDLLHDMRKLRNNVAHKRDSMESITQDQALNYAQAAIDMTSYFENLRRAG